MDQSKHEHGSTEEHGDYKDQHQEHHAGHDHAGTVGMITAGIVDMTTAGTVGIITAGTVGMPTIITVSLRNFS